MPNNCRKSYKYEEYTVTVPARNGGSACPAQRQRYNQDVPKYGQCKIGAYCTNPNQCETGVCDGSKCTHKPVDCEGAVDPKLHVFDATPHDCTTGTIVDVYRITQPAEYNGKACTIPTGYSKVSDTEYKKTSTYPKKGKCANYHTCSADEQCQSGECGNFNFGPKKCCPDGKSGSNCVNLPNGEGCSDPNGDQCHSGKCNNFKCEPSDPECRKSYRTDGSRVTTAPTCAAEGVRTTTHTLTEPLCRGRAGIPNPKTTTEKIPKTKCSKAEFCDGGTCKPKRPSCDKPKKECAPSGLSASGPYTCHDGDECASGFCANDGIPGVLGICRPGKSKVSGVGEWCNKANEGACKDGSYCGDYLFDGGVCLKPKPSCDKPKKECAPSGINKSGPSTCHKNDECESGFCANDGIPGVLGMCRPGKSNVSGLGEWCNKTYEEACKDGTYCGDYLFDGGVCTKQKPSCDKPKKECAPSGINKSGPHTCHHDDECESGFCANDGIPGVLGICRPGKSKVSGAGQWCNKTYEGACKDGTYCGDFLFDGGVCEAYVEPGKACKANGPKCTPRHYCSAETQKCEPLAPALGQHCEVSKNNRSRIPAEWFRRGTSPGSDHLGDSGNCDATSQVCDPNSKTCVARGADCAAGWASDWWDAVDEDDGASLWWGFDEKTEGGTRKCVSKADPTKSFVPASGQSCDGWREDPSKPNTCYQSNWKRNWVVKQAPGPGGKKCKNPDGSWATHPSHWPPAPASA
jgi:hypothetical protein